MKGYAELELLQEVVRDLHQMSSHLRGLLPLSPCKCRRPPVPGSLNRRQPSLLCSLSFQLEGLAEASGCRLSRFDFCGCD